MTREELQALGLSEEEIAEILAANGESTGGTGLPLPLMKVSYDNDTAKGNFIYNPQKDEEGFVTDFEDFGKEIEIIPFALRAQYSKFDANINNTTVLSNIFEPYQAKQAVDMKSGQLISELKKTDEDIKWSNILVGVVRKAGSKDEWKPFMMYLRGSLGFGANELFNKVDNGGRYTHIFKLVVTKAKKGAIIYHPIDDKKSDFMEIPEKEKAEIIKSSIPYAKAFNDWVSKINSGGSTAPATKQTSTETVSEDDMEL